jgi:2'-5' RNA ligase
MHSVVVLLDRIHAEAVQELWTDLETQFGVRGVQNAPYPHVSLLAFRGYNLERISSGLKRVARRQSRFRVHAHGYGFFCGQTAEDLTLHIPLVRSERLSAFHSLVRHELADVGQPGDGFYQTQNWSPHVTLADRDLTPGLLGEIVQWLATRAHRSWTIVIDNLSFVHDAGSTREIRFRVPLQG